MILQGRDGQVKIRREGSVVLMEVGGRSVAMPWEAALAISKHLRHHGKLAEEHAKAEQIILDNAILHRAGAPFGLSQNRDIVTETVKEAAWNSDLRRYMRGGVKAKGIVYPPGLYKHPPENKDEQHEPG